MTDVAGLAAWLQRTHAQRTGGAAVTACVLLTAGPAAGKTCLLSQLVMHTLEATGEHGGLVPVSIKIQNLQKRLLSPDEHERFARAWNWVDAYLQSLHGADSELYRMLRQAMLARRTLLLLDGLDEGGQVRSQIERHVTEVLAPQGHVMLVTSRPAGVREDLFAKHFHRVTLRPLSEEQQKQVIEQRIDAEHVDELMQYVSERVPRDVETGIRVTGNPLMLSMVVSIFESRVVQSKLMQSKVSSEMPKTIAELYQVKASNTMSVQPFRPCRPLPFPLSPHPLPPSPPLPPPLPPQVASNAASTARSRPSPHLRRLLEATFFQAHAAQRRIIDDEHLETAALDLHDPTKLAALRWPAYEGDASAGHYVQILSGEHTGRFATVTRVNARGDCAVELENKKQVAWVRVKSSGLGKAAFLASYGDEARSAKVYFNPSTPPLFLPAPLPFHPLPVHLPLLCIPSQPLITPSPALPPCPFALLPFLSPTSPAGTRGGARPAGRDARTRCAPSASASHRIVCLSSLSCRPTPSRCSRRISPSRNTLLPTPSARGGDSRRLPSRRGNGPYGGPTRCDSARRWARSLAEDCSRAAASCSKRTRGGLGPEKEEEEEEEEEEPRRLQIWQRGGSRSAARWVATGRRRLPRWRR